MVSIPLNRVGFVILEVEAFKAKQIVSIPLNRVGFVISVRVCN